jgi:hypothetical protein
VGGQVQAIEENRMTIVIQSSASLGHPPQGKSS